MDETKETRENPLSETETASEGSEGTTPKAGEAKTQYTQEDVDKLLQSDRIKRGRDDKTLGDRKAELDAREDSVKARLARIEEWERQQDAAELVEAQKDPAKMRAYQAKQAERKQVQSLSEREANLKKREADLSRREAETEAKVTAAEEATLGLTIYEIAARHDLNPEDLKAGVKKLNLKTVEQAESLAISMSTAGERPPGSEGEIRKTTPVTVPTSGGPRGKLTPEQFEKLPIKEKERYLREQ